jgi:1,2-diacylglycerol 3-alpha-glucosyltransferase
MQAFVFKLFHPAKLPTKNSNFYRLTVQVRCIVRIMMLSHGYPPTLSGVTLVVQKLSRALVRRGHEVMVVTASETRKPYTTEDEGVQLRRLRSLPNPFWSDGPIPWISLPALKQLVDEFHPDIVHTHENFILSTQLLRLGRTPGVPRISSCYSLPRFASHYLHWGAALERHMETFIWKRLVANLNHYDTVIFSTHTQQQEYIDHGLKVPSLAISNGVDTRRYFPVNGHVEDAEVRYQLPARPRILFVGRLMKDKRIDLLIQAMKHVCARQEAHLLIVGRGDEREHLETQVHRLGLERNIHLLGYVPEADLPALYRSTDLFAIASVCEVQSIPALQAVATGLPIVAVNAAALPELVRPAHNGFLVPPDDPAALGGAMLAVIHDPAYQANLSRGSLDLVRGHSEEATFRAYEDVYGELGAKPREKPAP